MSVIISEKHGVNPSLLCCPICQKGTGIALLGRIKGDVEAPMKSADVEPCEECKGLMAQGFLLVERDGDYITGNQWVVTHKEARWIFGSKLKKCGAAHIEPEAAKKVGLYAMAGMNK